MVWELLSRVPGRSAELFYPVLCDYLEATFVERFHQGWADKYLVQHVPKKTIVVVVFPSVCCRRLSK
ncbi:MAG: hypothetical protein M3Y56_11245, partial [Armatimonadota bacterium]|nr:hypothetical protein [Armatimonadota bacterium]